jgi:hypothetical protein
MGDLGCHYFFVQLLEIEWWEWKGFHALGYEFKIIIVIMQPMGSKERSSNELIFHGP